MRVCQTNRSDVIWIGALTLNPGVSAALFLDHSMPANKLSTLIRPPLNIPRLTKEVKREGRRR